MINEDQLEQLAIQWFQDTGWNYVHGAVIAPERRGGGWRRRTWRWGCSNDCCKGRSRRRRGRIWCSERAYNFFADQNPAEAPQSDDRKLAGGRGRGGSICKGNDQRQVGGANETGAGLLRFKTANRKMAYHHECRELVKTSGSLVRCFDLADERAARPYRKMSYATCIGCCHA